MTFRDADEYLALAVLFLPSVLAVAMHARLHIIRGNMGHAPPRSGPFHLREYRASVRSVRFLFCFPCR